jgi:hypothetical protein
MRRIRRELSPTVSLFNFVPSPRFAASGGISLV